MNNPYVLKTRYIHFPEKYFNRPPYYGTFKKAFSVNINPIQPEASIDNVCNSTDGREIFLINCLLNRLIIQLIRKVNGKNHVKMEKNSVRMQMI